MPTKPMCQPDGPEIKRRIFARGYTMAGFARKIRRPQSVDTMRNICMENPPATSVEFIRQIAAGLSTPKRPVKPSDISDWTGDDDLYDEPEPQPKALASLDAKNGPAAGTTGPTSGIRLAPHSNKRRDTTQ